MRPRLARLLLLSLGATASFGAPQPVPPGTVPEAGPLEAIASYDLVARLDPDTHRVEASGTARWRNPAVVPADRICLHLYLNAFASPRSTFLREADPELSRTLAAEGWGGIDLHSLRDAAGRELLDRLEPASPDDGNGDDRTVAWLKLPAPVPPGGSLTLDLRWTARLPALVDRAGWLDDYHTVAQWFPKIGRRRADGSWSCHQFHAASEFAADFGDYRVSLDVPAGWKVGATGQPATPTPGGAGVGTLAPAAGRARLELEARRVHDFAWVASPDLVEEQALLPRPGGEPVALRLLLQPGSLSAAVRLRETLAFGLARFGERYGAYPYPTLTLIEPPRGGDFAEAMEYPTLFTMRVAPLPSERFLELEETALHELAHQWWQGVVASDEAEEPFLDEGLATYVTARLLAERWGGRAAGVRLLGWTVPLPGPPLDPFDEMRLRERRSRSVDPVARTAWGYRDPESYGDLAYEGMALALAQIERLVGRETFDRGLAAFARQARFAYPTSRDLVAALSTAAGEDLSPLWTELVERAGPVDFAVTAVQSVPAALGGVESAREAGFLSTVTIERRGERRLPVEVELLFADGSTRRATWDGRDAWARLRATGPELRAVRLDPERRLLLDTDRLDDSRRLRGDPAPRRALVQRLRFLLQLVLEALADLA